MAYPLEITPKEYLLARDWIIDEVLLSVAAEEVVAPYRHPIYLTFHPLYEAYLIQLTEDIGRIGGLQEFMRLADERNCDIEF